MSAKTWKAGVADEPWKVAICKRDIEQTRQIIESLVYIIGSEDQISKMSGAEILASLRAYSDSARSSIQAARAA